MKTAKASLGVALIVGWVLIFGACSTVTLQCPPDRIVTATINGPDYLGAITTLAGQVAALSAGGMLMAKAPSATPSPTSNGTLSISTLAWGNQTYSCGSVAPVVASRPALKAPAPESMQETPTPMAMAAPLPPMFVH